MVPTLDNAVSTFETNYYGVKRVTKAILPLLRASEAGARVVNVTSRAGMLENVHYDYAKKVLANVEELSEEVIEKLVETFYADVKQQNGKKWNDNWSEPSYTVSKAAANAYTRLLAKELAQRPAGQKIYVNSFCPGFTTTDMVTTHHSQLDAPLPDGIVYRDPDVGAAGVVWLILLPTRESPIGIFSSRKGVLEF